jgi:hypothetical protein
MPKPCCFDAGQPCCTEEIFKKPEDYSGELKMHESRSGLSSACKRSQTI